MKQSKWIVAMMLVAFSSLAVAQIGSTQIVTQVPFDFMVAGKIVPAGHYTLQAGTMDGKTLSIRNSDAKVNLFSSSRESESAAPAASYSLLFKHYGDSYFLSGVKLQGSRYVYCLPVSKAEAELRAQNVSAREETVIASIR